MQLAASKPPAPAPCTGRQCRDELLLELQTKVREDFTITGKAPISAFTFKTHDFAKQALIHGK